MGQFKFYSIGSSSNGNCYFVGTDDYGFLIDAGIPVRNVKRALKEHNIALEQIFGIFLTHDHTDHVQYVEGLGEVHKIPIYATKEVYEGIKRNSRVKVHLTDSRHIFRKCEAVNIRDFTFQSFPVSHDASDCMGYAITFGEKTLVIATDLGFIGKEAANHIAKANFLVIEANYDENMLKNGPYPYHLKQRVSSHTGHLSNVHTANFLADNWHENLTHVFLCHISGDNNTPEIALQTVSNALSAKNIVPKMLIPLNRTEPTEMVILSEK
ncbi:MAG: MBL fold metallo-hydrolase [Prevotellaceae bacterium]|jgi:phosphoribosyl 1,2-cyclic phosphodiesterase|nr:MBL fold metallo-hydrolase [Prevotellaceae bacterium]